MKHLTKKKKTHWKHWIFSINILWFEVIVTKTCFSFFIFFFLGFRNSRYIQSYITQYGYQKFRRWSFLFILFCTSTKSAFIPLRKINCSTRKIFKYFNPWCPEYFNRWNSLLNMLWYLRRTWGTWDCRYLRTYYYHVHPLSSCLSDRCRNQGHSDRHELGAMI